MATTNLISKSLGDVLTESGSGTPDHVSPRGSLYVDQNTGKLYQNSDGTSIGWRNLTSVAYTTGFYQDNVAATTISTQNVWASVGNTFTEGDVIGFSANTDTLVLLNGYDGDYEISGDVTIDYVAGTNNYEVGVSIDGSDPIAGTYNGALVDSTYTRQHIGFESIETLSGGNTVSLDVRNITNNDNVIIRHAQISVRKVD